MPTVTAAPTRSFRLPVWPIALGALLLTDRDARACGGLFCNGTQPVIQTGEFVIFGVDKPNNRIDAIINIQYSGPAPEFAWVLPLQSAPVHQDVANTTVFNVLNQLTTPTFQLRTEFDGICADNRVPAIGSMADEATISFGPPVNVISQQEVGPYQSVVLSSTSATAMREWLVSNEYFVTDDMMKVVSPYVVAGDVLLALKLRKDFDVGAIQPFWVTLEGDTPCVPIRLTSIAAQDDLEMTVMVLSNEGRAIPKNYFHLELNLARIDWASQGSNYRTVVAEAADEAQGNAFVTEFSGSARTFDGVFSSSDNNVQRLFNRFSHATRLYTLISPEEMSVDPEFSFRPDLPDVSNVHTAVRRVDCGFGGSPLDSPSELVIEETALRIPGDSFRRSMPSAALIEQLEERSVITDNRGEIEAILARKDTCSCHETGTHKPSFVLWGLLGLLVSRRRLGKKLG